MVCGLNFGTMGERGDLIPHDGCPAYLHVLLAKYLPSPVAINALIHRYKCITFITYSHDVESACDACDACVACSCHAQLHNAR